MTSHNHCIPTAFLHCELCGFSEVRPSTKRPSTFSTLRQLFSSVNSLMLNHDRATTKGIPTIYTHMAFIQSELTDDHWNQTFGWKISHICYTHTFLYCQILWCYMRIDLWLKHFPQALHSYGFSLVWNLWWLVRRDLWWKDIPHFLHSDGFSPGWTIWCLLKVEPWLKDLPQSLDSCDFSPVLTLWCLVK